MPTRIVTAAAVAVAFVCPAHAETRMFVTVDDSDLAEPAIFVPTPDRGRLDHVQLSVDGAQGRATLTLALSSKEKTAHTIATTLDVPPGTKVTGMAVTIAGITSHAKTLAAPEAREQYRTIVRGRQDPALLELAASNRYYDRLSLDVFPISKTSPATVEIMLELPAATIAIQTPAPLDVALDGKAITTGAITLPARAAPAATSSQLSLVTSLFADGGIGPLPTVTLGGWSSCRFDVSVNSRDIRKQVKLAHPRLRHCYMRAAQANPKLAGTAVMHFVIMPAGHTQGISVDGTLDDDDVRACIADEIATWTFHKASGTVQVNYPLQFVLADN